ncbi:MFS transporter [Microbacterium sp. NPDC058389]|uniref:MFS transporter n=1 Tax=Microbacterium sp. NPDC058389 TaxID=3346475 RepID=UPI003663C8F8
MAEQSDVTVASGHAVHPVTRTWLLCFALAWFGFWLLVMLPGQFMVVKLASVIAPDDKVALGSLLIGEMSAVIVICIPIIGWLCDRSRPRFGRRRTWAAAGVVLATLSFAFVGFQTTWIGAVVLLGLVAVGEAAMLVSLSAVIADQVPVAQRGRASAAMGVPQVIALAAGMVVVTEVVTDVPASWMVIAAIAAAAPMPFLILFREQAPAPTAPRQARARRPLRDRVAGYRDFGWTVTSRTLVNAGNLIGTTYLLFFLADVLRLPDPDGALMVLILVYLGFCALASWLGGLLTDRFAARRAFVLGAALLQAAAALLLSLLPTWESSIAAAVLLGLGYGLFLSVDQALLTDVLPHAATRARDIGIAGAVQYLPIAAVVGWLVLTVAGYSQLYAVAAAVMALGGFAVLRVRTGG